MVRLELTPLASECVHYIDLYNDELGNGEPYLVSEICDEDIDDAEAWWYAIKRVMERVVEGRE